MTTSDAAVEPADALVTALTALQRCVVATPFDLATAEQADQRHLRDRVAGDIAGHIARIRDIDAPLLVVLGGVTGAGKSTFLNTMVGRDVVATGPVRPTTHAPTLVCHPTEAEWFTSDRVLPELARVETDFDVRDVGASREGVLRVISSGTVPPGLALVDAPDVDSVASANRELADQLLDAADLWLWFTTGGKYADEESMRYLRRARARRTALGVVLTQVHRVDLPEVRADFIGKLADEGLPDARLFTIHVTAIRAGRLPVGVGDELRTWLRRLADPEARRAHRTQTLQGGLDAVPDDVGQLIDAVGDELHQVRRLLVDVDHAYDGAQEEFAASLDEGMPLRGEVVDRWDRFVGGSRVLKLTEAATGQARAWIRGLLANAGIGDERRLERQVRVEVAGTVTATAGQLADLAAATVVDAWSATPAGRALS
ncbi:MAG: dynamin family protein, partial [Actinomycetota bacterium]|nr:dynamin family protein [Actinomycetota bacterium]